MNTKSLYVELYNFYERQMPEHVLLLHAQAFFRIAQTPSAPTFRRVFVTLGYGGKGLRCLFVRPALAA